MSKKTRLLRLIRNTLLIVVGTAVFVAIMFLFNIKSAKAEAIHGDRPVRGWFWYDDPKKPEQPKVEAKKQQKEEPKKEEPKKEELKKEPKKEDKKEEFEFPVIKEAPEVVRQFLKEPTEENARKYLAWQYKYFEHLKKIGYNLRNAYLRYADQIYPVSGYPENVLESLTFLQQRDNLIAKHIASVRDKVGLIYFYSTDCPICQLQKPILLNFLEKHGLSARGVTDGMIDHTLPFPSSNNIEIAEEYGVNSVPSILVVIAVDGRPKIHPLGVGLTSVDQMEAQIIRFMILEGLIKEKDLNPIFSTGFRR